MSPKIKEKPIEFKIAMVCNSAEIALAETEDNFSKRTWYALFHHERLKLVNQVNIKRENLDFTPQQVHEAWKKVELAGGWTYGKMHDTENKHDPSLKPWHQLPEAEQFKYKLHNSIMEAFLK